MRADIEAEPRRVKSSDALKSVRAYRELVNRPVAVLDDDPTGSQSVSDVDLLTDLRSEGISGALWNGSQATYLWTNSRSLSAAHAFAQSYEIGRRILLLAQERNGKVDVVSRSDSTLRGHVITEVDALQKARESVLGSPYDVVVMAPAYFEAGRVTEDGVHWVVHNGKRTPVGSTEYARDRSFGFRSSRLPEFLEEKSRGRISAASVVVVSLSDIRNGGPVRVAEILSNSRGSFVVVDGLVDEDYDIVANGAIVSEQEGVSLLYRTGPSFVRSLIGMDSSLPIDEHSIPAGKRKSQYGLVVVGSHVANTTKQIEAIGRSRIAKVVVEVEKISKPEFDQGEYVRELSSQVARAIRSQNVLLITSRKLVDVGDPGRNLDVARRTSAVLAKVVSTVIPDEPAWMVAKGGITSHDVAVSGIQLRRGKVLGQIEPGIISIVEPIEAHPRAIGMPYVVFAGNVGNANSLARTVEMLERWVEAWRT